MKPRGGCRAPSSSIAGAGQAVPAAKSGEVRPAQVGRHHDRVAHLRIGQPCLTQVGAGEVGAGEVGLLEVGVPQIGAPQVGVPERGQPHVGSRENQPLEPGVVELDSSQGDPVAHEVLQGVHPPPTAAFSLRGIHHLPGLIVGGLARDLGRLALGLLPLAAAEPELPGAPPSTSAILMTLATTDT